VEQKASAEHLYICTGSGDLFGRLAYGGGPPTHEQRCLWYQCAYREAPWHQPRTDLPEPGGDFPTALELCHCCAGVLIPSGSKFSSFFCEECRAAVQQLRETVGFTVIPFGRHSIMNGMNLSGAAARNPRLLAQFASATQHSFDCMDRLFAWQRGVVADHAAVIRPGAHYVSAPEYLAFVERHGLPKADMFQQLCRFFGATG
jgi:hypothetical protein